MVTDAWPRKVERALGVDAGGDHQRGEGVAALVEADELGGRRLAKLNHQLGIEAPGNDRGFERFNIAPTQEVLAVVDDRDGRRFEELRWGSCRTGPRSRNPRSR
jgi:hypothetical protein